MSHDALLAQYQAELLLLIRNFLSWRPERHNAAEILNRTVTIEWLEQRTHRGSRRHQITMVGETATSCNVQVRLKDLDLDEVMALRSWAVAQGEQLEEIPNHQLTFVVRF